MQSANENTWSWKNLKNLNILESIKKSLKKWLNLNTFDSFPVWDMGAFFECQKLDMLHVTFLQVHCRESSWADDDREEERTREEKKEKVMKM